MNLLSVSFTVAEVAALRRRLRRRCADAGLAGDALDDFVLAMDELVADAVRHGGGSGRLQLDLRDDTITCEVRDGGGTGMLRPHLPAGDIPAGAGCGSSGWTPTRYDFCRGGHPVSSDRPVWHQHSHRAEDRYVVALRGELDMGVVDELHELLTALDRPGPADRGRPGRGHVHRLHRDQRPPPRSERV